MRFHCAVILIKINKVKIYLLVIVSFFYLNTSGQELNKADKKQYNLGLDYFLDEDYNSARVIFEELFITHADHAELNYYIGACFLNTRYLKQNAIPFLLKAISEDKDMIPSIVHKDMGDLYHMSYDFEKAIYHYNKYIEIAPRKDIYLDHSKRMLEVCTHAIQVIKDTLDVNIYNISAPVNTHNSEFAPYTSADDNILFFTRRKFYTDEELKNTPNPDTLSQLFIAKRTATGWGEQSQIELKGIDLNQDVSLAGISPDGQFVYINALNNGQQDIYKGQYSSDNKMQLEPLPYPINSEYWEGKVTISPDESELWFSSERPNGIGGKDIYTCLMQEDGSWGIPELAGPEINTPFHEDAPFIHPSGKIFYFSSTGHNTIGGYDVFSLLKSEQKTMPSQNMGFPINTTGDDMYFALTADGRHGYFSSSHGNKYGNHDIFKVEMNLNIPLTILKGSILAGEPLRPVGAKIRMLDTKSGNKMKYVYNPNPETGNYLIILPPGRDYTMIIESEEFLPQSIHIQIPDQIEFYELFQSIKLLPIISLGKQVGEHIQINNSFNESSKKESVEKDYDALFNLIDNIILQTDSIDEISKESRGLNLNTAKKENNTIEDNEFADLFASVDEAFNTGDTSTLSKIYNDAIVPDKFEQVFLYSDSEEEKDNLTQVIVGADTILTSPQMATYDEKTAIKASHNDLIEFKAEETLVIIDKKEEIKITPSMLRRSKPKDRRVILTHSFFFETNQKAANDSAINQISEITELLVNNNNLGVIIEGHSDALGQAENNMILSKKRSMWFLKQAQSLGLNPNRTILKYFGETLSTNNPSYDRRIDISIFELKAN